MVDVDVEAGETVLDVYERNGWGDGLPLEAPTPERVDAMLRALAPVNGRPVDPDEVIAVLPPRSGEATRRTIAINAVLAGCRPEHLPVLISAVRALAYPDLNLRGVNATTHPVAPLLIVHVSTPEGAELVQKARLSGAKIFGETCPQYLFLTRNDLDRPGMEGAKFMCSPPVRDSATQAALWRHLQAGTFSVVSSDHAPYRYDETGKLANGRDATFKQIANGMPGLAVRLPLLFSEGVNTGRITLQQFVALSATNAAKLYGLHPCKGSIAVGSDADIAIWDPKETRKVRIEDQHDNMDYTPYEGMRLTGWPVTVLSRGERVVDAGKLVAKPGRGAFVKRGKIDLTGIPGHRSIELDPAQNFGAEIAPGRKEARDL